MGLRDELRARKKREQIDLGTTEPLFIKTMSGMDRSEFMELSEAIEEKETSEARIVSKKNACLVALSLINDNGESIYTVDELDDVLGDLESSDIDAIVKASLVINKLTVEEQEGQEKN